MEPVSRPDDFERAKAAFLEGLRLQQAGEFAAAEPRYLEALRLVPGRPSALVNLAAVRLSLGRPDEAIESARAALTVEPDSRDALLHLGTGLARLGRLPAALEAFERLLSIDPQLGPAWTSKGELLRELRRFEQAAECFRQALALGADPELNRYYLAAVTATDAPPSPPASYVETLFDHYAEDFESHLVGTLRYDGHRRLVEGLVPLAWRRSESALDMGCGTGLCAPLLRPLTERLAGIDLSARMLDKARTLGLYDELMQGEVLEHLHGRPAAYDLLVASDVFNYLGDPELVFAAAAHSMSRGIFCFSLELLEEPGDAPFRLEPSLRYTHRAEAVLASAARHGFSTLATHHAQVRQDQGRPVAGLYVYLTL